MSPNVLNNLSVKQLKRAVAIKQRIARLEQELMRLINRPKPARAKTVRQRKMSAAARARIVAAAKARWAKLKESKRS
jgi:hypothetical protein